jgi:hypothetical protein
MAMYTTTQRAHITFQTIALYEWNLVNVDDTLLMILLHNIV